MAGLYLLGGRQRKLLLKSEQEWNLYESALILHLDTETGKVRTCVEYKSPPSARANDNSSVVFKSGTLIGDTLYACTSTEVLIFKLPQFERVGYISLPCFNDVHHVTRSADGNLLAASTGLDMVIKFNTAGEVLAEWCVLEEEPWSRFSRTVDYRKVESTKPHLSHPNFVFQLGEEVWVTRFRQRDAVCLNKPCLNKAGKRIDIGVQSPHDGLVWGDRIYFTTVDGRIVMVDRQTLQVSAIIDLKEIGDLKELSNRNTLLGWCRGLLPVDDHTIWVGFTRVRKTKIAENVLWVRSVFREGMIEAPTHIALYDTARGRCLQEFDLEPHGINIIFSIFAENSP
jgi:hypothetical protein